MTLVDGRILYEKGSFPLLDMEKIRYHAQKCVEDILHTL